MPGVNKRFRVAIDIELEDVDEALSASDIRDAITFDFNDIEYASIETEVISVMEQR